MVTFEQFAVGLFSFLLLCLTGLCGVLAAGLRENLKGLRDDHDRLEGQVVALDKRFAVLETETRLIRSSR